MNSHFISRVKPPTSTLDVVLQNRCFNGQSGSSLLLVNNQLAAFTKNDDTDIYDCHGKRIWKVEEDSQIKVYTDSGTYTLMSNIPYHGCNVTVYAQPSNQVVARIKLSSLDTLKSATSEYDVTIENQGPGVMDKLGLGRAEQRRLAPGIISICMPPFGLGGPLAGLRAYGSTVEQASGLLFVNGEADWVPSQQHSAFGDPVAGIYAAAVALAALYGRQNKGGAEIEMCQVECLFQLNADGIIADQCEGIVRSGSRRMAAAPVCVVATEGEENWLAVAVHDDKAWAALASLLGDARLSPQWSLAERKVHEDQIETALAAWAKGREAGVAAALLRTAGIAAAPVQPTHMLCEDAHLEAVGYWARLERRFVGTHVVPHGPLWFNGARVAMTAPAPTLGEHTAAVLRELA